LADASDKKVQVAKADEPWARASWLGAAPLQPQERREAASTACSSRTPAAPPPWPACRRRRAVSVNGTSVKSIDQVRAAVAKSDKSVALLIQRDATDLRARARRLTGARAKTVPGAAHCDESPFHHSTQEKPHEIDHIRPARRRARRIRHGATAAQAASPLPPVHKNAPSST